MFFGNINTDSFPGSLLGYTNAPTGGYWVYENKRVTLNPRDTVYYQVCLLDTNGNLHASENLKFSVTLENEALVLYTGNI